MKRRRRGQEMLFQNSSNSSRLTFSWVPLRALKSKSIFLRVLVWRMRGHQPKTAVHSLLQWLLWFYVSCSHHLCHGTEFPQVDPTVRQILQEIIVGDYAGQNPVHETIIVPHCGLQSAMMYDKCMRKMPWVDHPIVLINNRGVCEVRAEISFQSLLGWHLQQNSGQDWRFITILAANLYFSFESKASQTIVFLDIQRRLVKFLIHFWHCIMLIIIHHTNQSSSGT